MAAMPLYRCSRTHLSCKVPRTGDGTRERASCYNRGVTPIERLFIVPGAAAADAEELQAGIRSVVDAAGEISSRVAVPMTVFEIDAGGRAVDRSERGQP
jgi:hypothetical protein